MGFSFFKKDAKDGRPANTRLGATTRAPGTGIAERRTTQSKPSAAAQRAALARATGGAFAVTENALPDRELARSLAMQTAAKIDAIESEMANDFLKRGKPSQPEARAPAAAPAEPLRAAEPEPVTPTTAPPRVTAAPRNTAAQESITARGEAAYEEDPELDAASDIFNGSVDAIEVQSESNNALEEAAVLFANRQDDLAEAGLRIAMNGDPQVAADDYAWLMLLELLQQRGERAGYEQVSEAYLVRFGQPAPGWLNYDGSQEPQPEARDENPVVRLPPGINAGIVKPLEEFKSLALQHAALTLDASATRSMDLVGAELLLRVINAFKRASHELTLRGAEPLLVAARANIVPGRRDSSDAAWMLTLELQRLLNRQAEFEETGIEYCITYEVSPPSWEPPPTNIHVGEAEVEAPAAPPVQGAAIEWKGEIGSDSESLFHRLVSAAQPNTTLVVECRLLRRMAFSAASSLLGISMRLAQTGTRVEFRNVNSLVAALLHVLGIAGITEVSVRRI